MGEENDLAKMNDEILALVRRGLTENMPLKDVLEAVELAMIQNAYARHGNHWLKVSKALGIPRTTLFMRRQLGNRKKKLTTEG